MKSTLLFIAAAALALFAAYYFYSTRTDHTNTTSLQDFIPNDAVFIYENKKPSYAKKDKPDFASFLRRALRQDSVFISPLRSKEITLSLHITGKEDFGVIYYLPDSSILLDIAFKKLITTTALPKKRNFEGFPIVELKASGHGSLSYTTIGKNIIFSRQSLLIEDVIRSQKEEENNFRKKNDELFRLMPIDAGQGKVYANVNALARFCSLFLDNEMGNSFFKNLGSSVITDAKIEDETVALNGYATDSAARAISILSLFNDQHPVASEIQKIVSNRALIFVHYGISDFTSFNKRRAAYKTFYPQLNTKNIPPPDFYNSLGPESGYCYMEGSKGQTDDVMILQVKREAADKISKLISADQQPVENYANYLIYPVSSPVIMHDYLWPLTENKNLNFYTRHDPWFLFAENLDVLKGFINDIEEDNTWGKSADWNTFHNAASLETNLTIDFNGAQLTPWVLGKLSSRWDSLTAPKEWGTIQKGSFQFSRLNQSYYFNGVLQFDFNKKPSAKRSGDSAIPQISFPSAVTNVTLVRSHVNNAAELLIQTADKNLTLLSSDFKILFTAPLSDKINSQVYQIDLYKNRKLQYAFLSGHSLYAVDRLGRIVKGFPIPVETADEPEFLTIVDYDNTRNYHFLIADRKGKIIVTDKEGKVAAGWDKVSTQSSLLGPPRLVRSGGKDFVIAVDQKGNVSAYTKKGEIIKGFPAAAGIKPQGNWFFEKNTGGEDVVCIVDKEGVKVQLNLKGKIVNKENYVRSASDSRFSMMVTVNMEDYAVSRVDRGKIAVLNRKGEVIFERENPGSEEVETAFIIAAPGERIFCFRDVQQDFVHVFNDAGQPVFTRPLESTQLPKMVRKSKEGLLVFTILNNDVRKLTP